MDKYTWARAKTDFGDRWGREKRKCWLSGTTNDVLTEGMNGYQAAILLTPIAEKDALVSYVAETRRFAISIDQPDSIPQHIHFA